MGHGGARGSESGIRRRRARPDERGRSSDDSAPCETSSSADRSKHNLARRAYSLLEGAENAVYPSIKSETNGERLESVKISVRAETLEARFLFFASLPDRENKLEWLTGCWRGWEERVNGPHLQ